MAYARAFPIFFSRRQPRPPGFLSSLSFTWWSAPRARLRNGRAPSPNRRRCTQGCLPRSARDNSPESPHVCCRWPACPKSTTPRCDAPECTVCRRTVPGQSKIRSNNCSRDIASANFTSSACQLPFNTVSFLPASGRSALRCRAGSMTLTAQRRCLPGGKGTDTVPLKAANAAGVSGRAARPTGRNARLGPRPDSSGKVQASAGRRRQMFSASCSRMCGTSRVRCPAQPGFSGVCRMVVWSALERAQRTRTLQSVVRSGQQRGRWAIS